MALGREAPQLRLNFAYEAKSENKNRERRSAHVPLGVLGVGKCALTLPTQCLTRIGLVLMQYAGDPFHVHRYVDSHSDQSNVCREF